MGGSGRNEGGGQGVNPPPNVQRTLAFMLSRATLQKILDRKTPQMFYPISHTGGGDTGGGGKTVGGGGLNTGVGF